MIRLLSINEDIEEIRKKLSAKVSAPAYIAAANKLHNFWGKKPGESNYEKMSSLDLYLSPWNSGYCVNRENDDFYFDLTIASILYLVYPQKPNEKYEYYVDNFDIAKLRFDSTFNNVFLSEGDKVPEELQLFVQKIRYGNRKKLQDGIRFVVSEPFYNPFVKKEHWHLSDNLWIDAYKKEFRPLHPPGQYPKDEINTIDDFNRFGVIVEKEVGSCVVCRGTSGALKHFCTFRGDHKNNPMPVNMICSDCFFKMAEQVKWLLYEG